jgi:hypothetical membrane protein
MSTRFMRVTGWCGLLAPVIMAFTTFAAIALSPWFSWQENGLSALGVSDTSVLFNAGLIGGGLLSILFAIGLTSGHTTRSRLTTSAGGALIIGSVNLALVGIFPDSAGRIHDVVSIVYFLATTLGYVLWGLAWLRASEKVHGVLSIAAGVAALLALLAVPHHRLATAIPGLLSATIMSCWTVALAVKMIVEPSSFINQERHEQTA